MKKSLTLLIFSISTSALGAQVPWATYGEWVENSHFECWDDEGTPQMEPCNWSSLKTAIPPLLADQAPDNSVQRASGRNGGYCMMLVAQAFTVGPSTIVANGIATTGRIYADYDPDEGYVFTDSSDEKWYMPQVHNPDSIMGYYKFSPESGDKGKVEALIHTDQDLNPSTSNDIAQIPDQTSGTSNHNARARIIFSSAQSSWKRFSAPFNYTSTTQSKYMLIVCNAGDSTNAVDGTKMWIDDLEVVYNNVSLEEKDDDFLDFNLINGRQLMINTKNVDTFNLSIHSTDGKLIMRKQNINTNQITLPDKVSGGYYIFNLSNGQSHHTKKYFIK